MRMQIAKRFSSCAILRVALAKLNFTTNGLNAAAVCLIGLQHQRVFVRLKNNELSILHRTKTDSVLQNDEMRNEIRWNRKQGSASLRWEEKEEKTKLWRLSTKCLNAWKFLGMLSNGIHPFDEPETRQHIIAHTLTHTHTLAF